MSREQKLTLGLLFKPPVPGHGYIGLEEGLVVVQLLSHGQVFATPWTVARQASCPSPTPGVYSNSCPLIQ